MKYNLENGRLVPRGQYILLKYGGTRPTPAEGFHVAFDGWEVSGQYIVPKYKAVANAPRPNPLPPSKIAISDNIGRRYNISVKNNARGDKTLDVKEESED